MGKTEVFSHRLEVRKVYKNIEEYVVKNRDLAPDLPKTWPLHCQGSTYVLQCDSSLVSTVPQNSPSKF